MLMSLKRDPAAGPTIEIDVVISDGFTRWSGSTCVAAPDRGSHRRVDDLQGDTICAWRGTALHNIPLDICVSCIVHNSVFIGIERSRDHDIHGEHMMLRIIELAFKIRAEEMFFVRV